jgi:hypothetical protein
MNLTMRLANGDDHYEEEPVQTLEIFMKRSGFSPWGLRLHGGADYGTPLVALKVSSLYVHITYMYID